MPLIESEEVAQVYERTCSKFEKNSNWSYRLIEFDTWSNVKWYVSLGRPNKVILAINDKNFLRWWRTYDTFWELLDLNDDDIKLAVENILKATIKSFVSQTDEKVKETLNDIIEQFEEVMSKTMEVVNSLSWYCDSEETKLKFTSRIMEIISKKTKDAIVWNKWWSVFSFFK